MKKIILFLGIFFLQISFAQAVSYTNSSLFTTCSGATSDMSGKKKVPITNNLSAPQSGNFTCEEHGYFGGTWSAVIMKGTDYSCPSKKYASFIQCYNGVSPTACTMSGIGWDRYVVYCKTIDDTPPVDADITPFPSSGTNLLANSAETFTISMNPGSGSPLGLVKSQMELPNPPNILDSEITLTGPFSFIKPIHLVDNDRQANGGRSYDLKINQVCDQAGNCLNNPFSGVPIKYNVYANPNQVLNSAPYILGQNAISINQLSSPTNVADATTKTLSFILRDRYGNDIIPASGLGRQINVKITTDNQLYLNQYKRTGASSVLSTLANQTDTLTNYAQRIPLGNGSLTTLANQSSTNGIYAYLWKVYTPTANSSTLIDPNAKFSINTIAVDVTGTLGLSNIAISGTPVNSQFRPLYTTALTGSLRINGFLEGSIQSNTLTLAKDPISSTSTSNNTLYLEFGSGANLSSPSFDLAANSFTPPTTQSKEGNQVTISGLAPAYQSPFSLGVANLYTKFTQTLGAPFVSNAQHYLSSHIAYRLDGYDIAYNGDVIGKNNYFGVTISNDAGQNGIKVTGITSSKNTSEIIKNQFGNDISILGTIYKASAKKDVLKNVYDTIKFATTNNGTRTINDLTNFALNTDGTKLSSNSILYFDGLNGANVNLGNIGGSERIDGKKTIVVVGGNLYIRSDMYYNNKSTDILGIIVLKDANGNGGNVYIDPSVTNVIGTFVLDRALISYDGTNELGGDTAQTLLKNQLHIYGSIFSENTIGGSRDNPIKCPFYVTTCTQQLAQKYDMNYLRRYILNAITGLPVENGKVIGGGTCTNQATKACTGGSTSFAKNITNVGTDAYKNYPVVIEYNSTIAKVLPPLFGN